MTITVEDGTNVAGANSYVDIDELRAYALERGIILPVEDAAVEILLIKAMDYIELRDEDYRGDRVYTDQALSWPRIEYDMEIGIPKELKKLQMVLAVAAMTIDFFPVSSGTGADKKRTTVGPITVEYATKSSTMPRIPQADSLFNYLFGGTLNGQLRVVRA